MLLRSTHETILAEHQRRHNLEIRSLKEAHDRELATLRHFYEQQVEFYRSALSDQLTNVSGIAERVMNKYMPIGTAEGVPARDPSDPYLYIEDPVGTGLFAERYLTKDLVNSDAGSELPERPDE